MPTATRTRDPAAMFHGACAWLVGRLPARLAAVTAPTLVGFVLISAVSFSVDMLLLMVCKTGLRLHLVVAVTIAYAIALTVNFLLNRWLNFSPHRSLRVQVALHVAVVVVNFAVIVLGITVGLAHLGVPYPVARVVAGLAEVTFVYAAQRWVVFDHHDDPSTEIAADPEH
jgi:putative flippase GtrA